jgi:hypothetical protein
MNYCNKAGKSVSSADPPALGSPRGDLAGASG